MDGHGNWKGESMFHLKCPICGGLLNEFEDGTYEFYAVGCSQCEWQTFEYSSSIEAWSKAEQLILGSFGNLNRKKNNESDS